jgi:hypothetical protein
MSWIILAFFILLCIFQLLFNDLGYREAIIRSFLLTAVITAIMTELLSLFNLVTYQIILVSWVSTNGILVILFLRKLKLNNWSIPNIKAVRGNLNKPEFSWLRFVIVLSVSFILIVTFLIAICAPPNNYDSMTYHMPRVVHWIQQKSVEFYPTSIPRQNHSMPMAEYMILHLQILTQSDKYANLIQWSGFLILIVAVTDSARNLKISRSGQFAAGLFAATLPMAILQSSSTQNDIITSVFCLLFASYLLKMLSTLSWTDTFFAGISLGLALMTKGTAYIFCAAIGITIAIAGLVLKTTQSKIQLIKHLGLVVLCGLLLNTGFYSRNQRLYSHPLSTETGRVIVEKFSASGLYSNLIRNGSMHLAVPDPSLNVQLSESIVSYLGSRASDPNTTFSGTDFQIRYLINEDESGNLVHFISLVIILLIIPLRWSTRDRGQIIWAFSVMLAIGLFSALLKWQPWGSRLQLPIFSLGAPLVGLFFKDSRRFGFFPLVLTSLLFLSSLPFLFLNETRPLVPLFKDSSRMGPKNVRRFFSNRPSLYEEYAQIISPYYQDMSILSTDRQTLYFSGNMSIYEDYKTVMNQVNLLNEDQIGLYLGTNHWEYPIWVLADRLQGVGYPEFYHLGVENISQLLDNSLETDPEFVISTRMPIDGRIGEYFYELILDTPSIDLYKKR